MRATKRLMYDPAVLPTLMDLKSAIFNERLQTAEAWEAFTAFAERRPPDFSGSAS